ncbi:MAG: hypothetical protein K6T78_05650 [Alicyclobacillus sp.]|nr:hypothetical protein [Alicyclobacillus sp.]
MEFPTPPVRFAGATPYTFYFEHAQLVLLTWTRDDARFLFLVREQGPEEWLLDYPGETFTNRVLDTVERIFFIEVEETHGAAPRSYILGCYFTLQGAAYGAYYDRSGESPDVVLFRIRGRSPESDLIPLEGEEYARVAAYFLEQYA